MPTSAAVGAHVSFSSGVYSPKHGDLSPGLVQQGTQSELSQETKGYQDFHLLYSGGSTPECMPWLAWLPHFPAAKAHFRHHILGHVAYYLEIQDLLFLLMRIFFNLSRPLGIPGTRVGYVGCPFDLGVAHI